MPTSLTEFSLQPHDGPYESWPVQTPLLRHGEPTGASLDGYQLLQQYALADGGFLFITDFDCPFEETTVVTLMDAQLRLRDRRKLGAMYNSFLFESLTWVDERRFDLRLAHKPPVYWQYSIRRPGLFGLRRPLAMKQMREVTEPQR